MECGWILDSAVKRKEAVVDQKSFIISLHISSPVSKASDGHEYAASRLERIIQQANVLEPL